MTGLLLLGAAAGSYTAHVGSDTKCSAWQGGEPTDVFHVDTNVNVDTRGGDQSCEELQKKHEVDEVTPMVLTLLTVALLIAFAVCWERKCGGKGGRSSSYGYSGCSLGSGGCSSCAGCGS
jgi:hypothetical protein